MSRWIVLLVLAIVPTHARAEKLTVHATVGAGVVVWSPPFVHAALGGGIHVRNDLALGLRATSLVIGVLADGAIGVLGLHPRARHRRADPLGRAR